MAKIAIIALVIACLALIFSITLSEDEAATVLFNNKCNLDNNMLIREGGVWKCTSEADTEEDLRFPVQSLRLAGTAKDAEIVTFINNTISLKFDNDKEREAYFIAQLPHSREVGGYLSVHSHWGATTADIGNVSFCYEFTCANITGIFPYTSILCNLDETTGLNHHQITPQVILPNAYTGSAVCNFRFYRDPDSAADNYEHAILIHEIDIHYAPINLGMGVT